MRGLKYLGAICTLALTIGSATAGTIENFDISGTFDNQSNITSNGTFLGNIEIDLATGAIFSIDVSVSGYGIYSLVIEQSGSINPGADTLWLAALTGDPANPTSPFALRLPILPGNFVNFTVGSIFNGLIFTDPTTDTEFCNSLPTCADNFTGTINPAAAATPLPAALPLFATGLGAMGLLGWRRKRKNNAAVTAA
jgi:hypothetical protein